MSTATTPQSATCAECNGERDPTASVKGAYCSLDCYHRHKGRKALSEIHRDHRFCATCYRVRKQVDRPPEYFLRDRPKLIRDSIVGYEYPTEHLNYESGLTYCDCGAIDHDHTIDTLQELDLQTAIVNLVSRLRTLEREDALNHRPDGSLLIDSLRDTDFDVELSVGRAIYDGG